ncbi:MAG: hypothetical protein WDZ83_15640 [Rhizobiaceae bacterium]
MHRTVKVILSLSWIAVFGALAVVTLVAAVDGIAAARAAMPFAVPFFGIEPLASQSMMGGLSLGSALVTALFAWMMLTALMVEGDHSRGAGNPAELAHGGAFGIGGVIFLTTILGSSILLMVASGLLVAAMVLSLMLSRMALEPEQTLAPRSVRDRAIEAAHIYSVDMRRQSAEIVPFPVRGEFAREGQ